MAHKDLSEDARDGIEAYATALAEALHETDQSLGIGREVMITAFDKAASELEATDAKDQA